MVISDPVAHVFKNTDPRGSLRANVSNATVRCLSNMKLAAMLEMKLTQREIAKEILSKMLERKEKKFPNIKRMIMDFQISYKDGQHHLDVISSTNEQ